MGGLGGGCIESLVDGWVGGCGGDTVSTCWGVHESWVGLGGGALSHFMGGWVGGDTMSHGWVGGWGYSVNVLGGA